MSIYAIIAEIRRHEPSTNGSDQDKTLVLELRLVCGTELYLEFEAVRDGFLVMLDDRKPKERQRTYIPFTSILTVRPMWS